MKQGETIEAIRTLIENERKRAFVEGVECGINTQRAAAGGQDGWRFRAERFSTLDLTVEAFIAAPYTEEG